MSLRRRLVIAVLAVAGVLIATGFVVADRIHSFLIDRVDAQLQSIPPRLPDTSGPIQGSDPGRANPFSDVVVARVDAHGEVVGVALVPALDDPLPQFSDLAPDLSKLTPGTQLITTIGAVDGSTSFRTLVVAQRDGLYSTISLSLARTDALYNDVVVIEIIAGAAVLGVLALVAFWVLRQGVRPLRQIADTADAITDGDLTNRVEVTNPKTEAGRVGIAINRMLGQIEADFAEQEASEVRLKQFVSDASHELRTPLTSVQGYSELYQQGGLRDPGALDDAMTRVAKETARMGRLVDEMLTLARLDERRPLHRVHVDLRRVAFDAVRDARVVEPERSITLVADEPVPIDADEDLVRQVVANLLGNVRAHTPTETAARVQVGRDGADAVLTVEDDGPGIEEADASWAFERFTRADQARTRSGRGGSGLGLSIVQAAVDAHGGTVELESRPGAGTTVTVRLPLTAPAAVEVPGSEPSGTTSDDR